MPATTTAPPSTHAPWHREPYVWLVIFFPVLAVVAGLYTLRLAIESDDGLVVDDYYNVGLKINRVLDRDKRAEDLGLNADIALDRATRSIEVHLTSRAGLQQPKTLTLKLMHATRAGFDRTVTLTLAPDGTYYAELPPLALGHWYAQIEYADWRILRSLYLPPSPEKVSPPPGRT